MASLMEIAASYRNSAQLLKSWIDKQRNTSSFEEMQELRMIRKMYRECIAVAKYLENYEGDRSRCALHELFRITPTH